MKNLIVFVVLVMTSGCNKTAEASAEEDEVAVIAEMADSLIKEQETCFLYATGNENQDSTFVSLELSGDSVSGFMHWQPWQTDGAYGTISALKTGTKILGVYNYTIEGSNQSQEILFKIIDGKLHQGDGELKDTFEEEVMLVFKDTSAITYETVFTEIDCRLFKKY